MPSTPTDRAPFCPHCTYDLRAAPDTGRCPECGSLFNKSDLSQSDLPWPRRKLTGTFSAYLKTLLLVTFRPSRLGHDAANRQHWPDALAFVRLTAWFLAITATLAWATWMRFGWSSYEQLFSFIIMPGSDRGLSPWWYPAIILVDRPGVLIVLALSVFLSVKALAWLTRAIAPIRIAPDRRASAQCISVYTIAIWWLLPVLVGLPTLVAAIFVASWFDPHEVPLYWFAPMPLMALAPWWLVFTRFMRALSGNTSLGIAAATKALALLLAAPILLSLIAFSVNYALGLSMLMARSLVGW